ncbi:MAG: hypothetical protein L0241_15795, partial [Planctomycetia bacterium]|nr:hypothetical protein [Planctomycetia bacterium]
VLCYLEGLTAAEAAQRLGCPTGTVESRLASARKKLRETLTQRGITLPAAILAIASQATLAPEAVARVARTSAAFARGEVVVGETSVRLAKEILTMWRTRTWATLVALGVAALTATASIAWTDEPAPETPMVALTTPQPQPKPQTQPGVAGDPDPDKPAEVKWDTKPVWVASTVAKLHDISPDGKRFLYADGRKFGVFDRTTGKMVWQIDNTTLHSAKFSPNGRTIVAGEWENGLNLYDATSGKNLYSFVPPGNERIRQAAFRPDGIVLYMASYSGLGNKPPWAMSYSIVHWDPIARKEIRNFSESFKYENGNVWLWHRGRGFFMERLQAHGTNNTTHKTASYTNPMTGKATPPITLDANDTVFDVSPDGKAVLVRTVGKSPRVLDTTTGKVIHTLDGHKRVVTGGEFSPDGRWIATVSGTTLSNYDHARLTVTIPEGPAELVVWDAKTGKAISRAEFPTKELDFVEVHFSPDSKFLVALTRDAKDGKERKLIAFGQVPFGETGGVALNFPQDEALKPKPPVIAPKGGLVADPLDKLVEDLTKSNKPVDQKIDALFLAVMGRFATITEQKRIRQLYGDKLTFQVLQQIVAELVATPEFEAHLKSLEQRKPAKPGTPKLPVNPFWPGTGWPSGFDQYPNGWSGPWSYPNLPPPPLKKP